MYLAPAQDSFVRDTRETDQRGYILRDTEYVNGETDKDQAATTVTVHTLESEEASRQIDAVAVALGQYVRLERGASLASSIEDIQLLYVYK